MERAHGWVLGALLLLVLLLATLGVFQMREGFQSIVRCPVGYKFFNSPNGDSLCCKGTINPYTNTCSGTATDDICSLSGSVPDPRDRAVTLKNCRTLTQRQADLATNTCPKDLPHLAAYTKDGVDSYKCCANPVLMAGEEGYICSAEDLKDTTKYCIVDGKGTPGINQQDKKAERLCSEGKVLETTVCPKDRLGKDVFQRVDYVLGDREAKEYQVADLKGLTIPTCYRLTESCIPKEALAYAKKRGAFTEYDADTWKYSCAVWEKQEKNQPVSGRVDTYPDGVAAPPPS